MCYDPPRATSTTKEEDSHDLIGLGVLYHGRPPFEVRVEYLRDLETMSMSIVADHHVGLVDEVDRTRRNMLAPICEYTPNVSFRELCLHGVSVREPPSGRASSSRRS